MVKNKKGISIVVVKPCETFAWLCFFIKKTLNFYQKVILNSRRILFYFIVNNMRNVLDSLKREFIRKNVNEVGKNCLIKF